MNKGKIDNATLNHICKAYAAFQANGIDGVNINSLSHVQRTAYAIYKSSATLSKGSVERIAHQLHVYIPKDAPQTESTFAEFVNLATGLSASNEYDPKKGSTQSISDVDSAVFSTKAFGSKSTARSGRSRAFAASEQEDNSPVYSGLDRVQMALDVMGMFEPTPFTDVTNSIVSMLRAVGEPDKAGSHMINAGISIASTIPIIGDYAKTYKPYGRRGSLYQVMSGMRDRRSRLGRMAHIGTHMLESVYGKENLQRMPMQFDDSQDSFGQSQPGGAFRTDSPVANNECIPVRLCDEGKLEGEEKRRETTSNTSNYDPNNENRTPSIRRTFEQRANEQNFKIIPAMLRGFANGLAAVVAGIGLFGSTLLMTGRVVQHMFRGSVSDRFLESQRNVGNFSMVASQALFMHDIKSMHILLRKASTQGASIAALTNAQSNIDEAYAQFTDPFTRIGNHLEAYRKNVGAMLLNSFDSFTGNFLDSIANQMDDGEFLKKTFLAGASRVFGDQWAGVFETFFGELFQEIEKKPTGLGPSDPMEAYFSDIEQGLIPGHAKPKLPVHKP